MSKKTTLFIFSFIQKTKTPGVPENGRVAVRFRIAYGPSGAAFSSPGSGGRLPWILEWLRRIFGVHGSSARFPGKARGLPGNLRSHPNVHSTDFLFRLNLNPIFGSEKTAKFIKRVVSFAGNFRWNQRPKSPMSDKPAVDSS